MTQFEVWKLKIIKNPSHTIYCISNLEIQESVRNNNV